MSEGSIIPAGRGFRVRFRTTERDLQIFQSAVAALA